MTNNKPLNRVEFYIYADGRANVVVYEDGQAGDFYLGISRYDAEAVLVILSLSKGYPVYNTLEDAEAVLMTAPDIPPAWYSLTDQIVKLSDECLDAINLLDHVNGNRRFKVMDELDRLNAERHDLTANLSGIIRDMGGFYIKDMGYYLV